MSRPDPHDPRKFLHYARIASDGAITTLECAEGAGIPRDGVNLYIEITDIYPYDFADKRITLAADDTPVLTLVNQGMSLNAPVQDMTVTAVQTDRSISDLRAQLVALNTVTHG